MKLNVNFHVSAAIFFRLDINLVTLREIFSKEGFAPTPLAAPKEIAPGVSIGATEIPITMLGAAKVMYNPDRYLLRIESELGEIYDANKKLASMFEKHFYPFTKTVRYCEFNFPEQLLEIPDLVYQMRSKINATIDVETIFGIELKPYAISFSYPESALNDNWMYVYLSPAANSPTDRLVLKITKRTQTHDELLDFLSNIEHKIMQIPTLFGRDE